MYCRALGLVVCNPFDTLPAAILRHHVFPCLTGQELIRFVASSHSCAELACKHAKAFHYVLPPGSLRDRSRIWQQAEPAIARLLHRLKMVQHVLIDTSPFTFDELDVMRLAPTIQTVDIVSDDVEYVKALPQLTSLGVHLACTDAYIKQISRLSHLTALDISRCTELTADHMRLLLGGMQCLTTLRVGSCASLSDSCLHHVAQTQTLTSLDIHGCTQVTDNGIAYLAALKQLKYLDLSSCSRLTDTALQVLTELPRLSTLRLYDLFSISDHGMHAIAGISTLTQLDIGWCPGITDAGVRLLARLPRLRRLGLASSRRITQEGVNATVSSLTSLRCLDVSGTDIGWNDETQPLVCSKDHVHSLIAS